MRVVACRPPERWRSPSSTLSVTANELSRCCMSFTECRCFALRTLTLLGPMRCSRTSEPVGKPPPVRMKSCQKPTMCREIDWLLALQQRKLAFKLTVLYAQALEFLR